MPRSDPAHESTENTDRFDSVDPLRTKEWHKRVLMYLATSNTPASPWQIREYLDKYEGMSRSYNAIATACQKTLSDFIITHDKSRYGNEGERIKANFKYTLKTDLQTFYILHDMFDAPDMYNDFSSSSFFLDMISVVPYEFDRAMPFWCCTLPADGGILPLVSLSSPELVMDVIQNVDDVFEDGTNAIVCAVATINGRDLISEPKDKYHLHSDEKEVIEKMMQTRLKQDISDREGYVFLILKPRLPDAIIKHLERYLESDRLTLRAILRYTFADYEKRDVTYKQIMHDLNNPEMVPGFPEWRRSCPCDEESDKWDDEIVDLHDAIYYHTGIDWIHFFGYLHHIFSHYGFLASSIIATIT